MELSQGTQPVVGEDFFLPPDFFVLAGGGGGDAAADGSAPFLSAVCISCCVCCTVRYCLYSLPSSLWMSESSEPMTRFFSSFVPTVAAFAPRSRFMSSMNGFRFSCGRDLVKAENGLEG